jgi:hypothetical protein
MKNLFRRIKYELLSNRCQTVNTLYGNYDCFQNAESHYQIDTLPHQLIIKLTHCLISIVNYFVNN